MEIVEGAKAFYLPVRSVRSWRLFSSPPYSPFPRHLSEAAPKGRYFIGLWNVTWPDVTQALSLSFASGWFIAQFSHFRLLRSVGSVNYECGGDSEGGMVCPPRKHDGNLNFRTNSERFVSCFKNFYSRVLWRAPLLRGWRRIFYGLTFVCMADIWNRSQQAACRFLSISIEIATLGNSVTIKIALVYCVVYFQKYLVVISWHLSNSKESGEMNPTVIFYYCYTFFRNTWHDWTWS